MPLSAAERCRKYREKLKLENPAKFEEMKKKNLERTKAKKRKIADMNEEEKQDIRKQWRDAKRKKHEKKEESIMVEVERTQRRRYRSQLQRKNEKLKEKNGILIRKNENLRRILTRYRKRIQRLTSEIHDLKLEKELRIGENQTKKIQIQKKTLQSSKKLTPMTKTNCFIDEELPNISQEAKDKVKQKLLQAHVIEDSLKETYKATKAFKEKHFFRKIAETETVTKYKMKTKVAKVLGLKYGIKRYYSMRRKKMRTANVLKKIFERDDVSRITPGKKDYKTKKKVRTQKRLLLDTLLKLHKKYKNEGGTLSFTTFKRYRPFYVVKPTLSERDTCACLKHSNLAFKVETLKKFGLIKTTDLNALLSEIVCDVKSKRCMYSECELCCNKQLNISTSFNQDTEVSWLAFTNKIHEYKKDQQNLITKRMVKSKETGTVSDLIKITQRDLKQFKCHYFNIHHQYIQYREAIDKVEDNEVILHCDFSENYVCKLAEEVQSMHFGSSKIQITLHTGVLYVKNQEPLCFCSVSPSLKHGPEAIWAHLKQVIDFIRQKYSTIDRIHVWSDGPTTQYRQKNNFLLFSEITKKSGFNQATWSFSEASHGKGAADGVGGAVKRTLDDAVKYGRDIVDAKSAFDILLSKTESSIKVFYVSEEDVENIKISNPEKVLPIPSTMKIHQVIVTQHKNTVKYRPLSCFCKRGDCDCYNTKTHILIKARNTRKPPRTQRKRLRKKNKRLDTSSENTDTEIEYAESDTSDWNEIDFLNYNDTEEQETYTDKTKTVIETEELIENKETRQKIENNLRTVVRTDEEISKTNKEEKKNKLKKFKDNMQNKEISPEIHNNLNKEEDLISKHYKEEEKTQEELDCVIDEEFEIKGRNKEKERVKILAEIRNSPENRKYFDLRKCRKSLKEIGLDFNIGSKENRSGTEELISKSYIEEENIFFKKSEENMQNKEILPEINNKVNTKEELTSKPYMEEEEKTQADAEIKQRKKSIESVNKNEKEHYDDIYTNPIQSCSGVDSIKKQEANKEQYEESDLVLVRYYTRKVWKYYIGFIEKINIEDDETLYTITYLRTLKSPELKFIMPKKLDVDIVTNVSIVKKVRLSQQSKEYCLVDDFDRVYFC